MQANELVSKRVSYPYPRIVDKITRGTADGSGGWSTSGGYRYLDVTIDAVDTSLTVVKTLSTFKYLLGQEVSGIQCELTSSTNLRIWSQLNTSGTADCLYELVSYKAGTVAVQSVSVNMNPANSGNYDTTITAVDVSRTSIWFSPSGERIQSSSGNNIQGMEASLTSSTNLRLNVTTESGTGDVTPIVQIIEFLGV